MESRAPDSNTSRARRRVLVGVEGRGVRALSLRSVSLDLERRERLSG